MINKRDARWLNEGDPFPTDVTDETPPVAVPKMGKVAASLSGVSPSENAAPPMETADSRHGLSGTSASHRGGFTPEKRTMSPEELLQAANEMIARHAAQGDAQLARGPAISSVEKEKQSGPPDWLKDAMKKYGIE